MAEVFCDSEGYDMIEELIEGFDESFNRTTQVWNPKVPDLKLKPYIGWRFKDIDSCFDFYTEHGRHGGFNVRKSSHKVRNRIVVSKYLVCQKVGYHETSKIKEYDSKSESSHASNIVGNQIRKRNTVTKKYDCNAKIILKYIGPDGPDKYRHFLLDAAKSNIGVLRAHSIYTSLFSLYSDVGPTAMDFQNWMRDIKLYIGKHDADMLLQKFKIKQDTSDGGFFYEYETDSNGHLTRLFWADSSTFSSALLNSENETNFTWACGIFLNVFRRPPKCKITDQCLAMKVAIAKVLPDSVHRYCMWHIIQKFPSKVGPIFCAEFGFMDKLNKFVWSSHLTVAEFEEGWNAVLKEFGLTDHKGDTLSEFYMCYESAIDKQIYENKKLNDGDTCILQSVTEKQIEKHVSHLYTRSMFYKVQKWIRSSCFHNSLASQPIVVDGVNKYVVRDKSFDEKFFVVEFSFLKNDVQCSCLWGVERIPQQFLCTRWMRNVELRFSKLKFGKETECSNGSTIRDTSKQICIADKFQISGVTKDDMLQECFGVRPSGLSKVLPPQKAITKEAEK
ncbi:protein FAR1-RELATED SEQUENCE 5-like [Apium graveolens]|uniref:protein FAR1-RELATED SEQUENCE 5-like n=1 Tax=Apium graveolens TaxID=4045 RepID=UPI003D7A906C